MSLSGAYTTVSQLSYTKYEEKRSVFIGRACPVKTEEAALAFIKEVKKEHRDATHNVFAFLLGDGTVARYSDDGEPQGTAGMPVLEAIRKNRLCDVCVVVTRYFGGTLLGAGGLIRAYSHSATLAIEAAGIITYDTYDVFSLTCGYSEYQKYSVLISASGAIIDSTDFGAEVSIRFALRKSESPALIKAITEAGYGKDVPQQVGERFDYR